MRKLYFIVLLIFTGVSGLYALDYPQSPQTNYQMNTIFQVSRYPFTGSGGKDILKTTSIGFSFKNTKGIGLHSVFDAAVLIPYRSELKAYPSGSFTEVPPMAFPVGLDILAGLGYMQDLDAIAFLYSGGLHINSLFEGSNMLTVFGLGVDIQAFVRLGKMLTAQIGGKFATDFGGLQTFLPGEYGFEGVTFTYAVYTGLGINY